MTYPSDKVPTSFLYTLEASLKEVHKVNMVREFTNVFHEIPRPPPKRHVGF